MRKQLIDMQGVKLGGGEVLHRAPDRKACAHWWFRGACGHEFIARGSNLRRRAHETIVCKSCRWNPWDRTGQVIKGWTIVRCIWSSQRRVWVAQRPCGHQRLLWPKHLKWLAAKKTDPKCQACNRERWERTAAE